MHDKATMKQTKHAARHLSGVLESLESRVLLSGSGLAGEYFIGNDFQTPVAVSTAPRIYFNWNYGRPLAVVPAGAYSVKWTGTITPARSDTYTFYTSADSGTNVIVNGTAVISNLSSRTPGLVSGSVALTAGVPVSIEVDYTSRDAHVPARMALLWSSSTFSRCLVPASVLTPAAVALPTEPLTASYYVGENLNKLVLTEAESSVRFNLAPSVPDALIPDGDSFSVNWTGTLIAPYTGNYVFKTVTDDGVRLFVNGALEINHYVDESSTSHITTVALTAGQLVPIRMEYYENGVGAAVAKLLWKVPGSNAFAYVPFTDQPPIAPTGVTATPFSASQVDLNWNDVADENGFIVERSGDGGATFSQIGTTARGVTMFDDTTATPGTPYEYEIIAVNSAGNSPASTAAPATTVPVAPINVAASTVSASQINVSWNDVTGETGFIIDRSSDGGTTFSQAGTTAQGVTTFADTGLAAGTMYMYEVVATDSSGSSLPSAAASATTLPAAPTNLTATVASATQVDLAWNMAAGDTGYIIQQSANGTTGWTQIASVASGTTTLNVGGLSPATTYYFRVLATGSAGDSSPSNVAHATTSAANPSYASLTTVYGLTSAGNVYSLDTSTGAVTQIGTLAFGTDAAGRDPLSGNFFYVSTGSSTIQIAEWNPNDGANTTINSSVPVGGAVAQAAFRDDGTFFITDDNGDLYSIDSTTGNAALKGTLYANGSLLPTGTGDMAFGPDDTLYLDCGGILYSVPNAGVNSATGSGSMITATEIGSSGVPNLQIAFGQNGVLYGDSNSYGQLYTLNTSTGAATAVGSPSGMSLNDLASIPLYGELTVAQSTSPFVRNMTGSYTLTVSNGGPDSTVGPITLVDTLPAGVSFTSGTGTGWSFSVSGSTVTMTYIPNVAANASAPAVTLNVNIGTSAANSVTNTVLASTTEFETNTANNTNSITSAVTG
jgi:fibronectin type 3 domain-containing protein